MCRVAPRLAFALILVACALALTAFAAQAMPTWTAVSPNVTDFRTSASSFPITALVSPANATVTVNGVSETPDAGGNVTVTIALIEGFNLVNFTATDWLAESAFLLFQIESDQTAPHVSLSPLENETITNQPTLPLQASLDEHGTAQVNGADMSTLDGFNFTAEFTLFDGLNVLYFHFEDDAGNAVDVVRQVNYDRFPPFLQVDSPADGALFNYTSLQVTGRTERDASLTINGAPATVSPVDGSFVGYVTLEDLFSQTENLLVIRAIDRAGNVVYENRSVWADTRSPSIEIDLPVEIRSHIEAGMPFNAEVLDLRGRTDSADATILVDGEEATFDGLSWNWTVQLLEGPNRITIEAFDQAGNHRVVVLFATRDSLAPVLQVNSPRSTSVRTGLQSMRLAGNVTGEESAVVRIIYTDPRGIQTMDVIVTNPEDDGSLSFSYDFGPLNTDGDPHSVEIQAVDGAGNMDSFNFEYTAQVGTPFLEVIGLRTVVEEPWVWVNGSTDPGITTVTINGQVFEVVDQSFAVRWELPHLAGSFALQISIEDDVGNNNTVSRTVQFAPPLPPPSTALALNNSADLTAVANAPTTLSLNGTVAAGVTIQWWVDGALVGNGSSVTVSFSQGEHAVSVVVSNSIENRTLTFAVHVSAPAAGPGPTGPTPAAGSGGAMVIAAIAAMAAAVVVRRRARPPGSP